MPKKRKSEGRSKGQSGRTGNIQCAACGAMVPIDKAHKRVENTSPVKDPYLRKELEKQGAYIRNSKVTKYYCISCAIHRGYLKIRRKENRR